MWLLGLFLRWRGVRVVVLTVHGLLIEDFGTTMLDSRLKFPEITRRIIGCAMAVHSELGNGFQEVVYQRALMVEMEREGLSFSREHEVPIWFKGAQFGFPSASEQEGLNWDWWDFWGMDVPSAEALGILCWLLGGLV